MSSVDDRNKTSKTPLANMPQANATGGKIGGGKEGEPIGISSTESLQEVTAEMELPKEVSEAGVENLSGTIELPPDVKKLGVTTPTQTLSQVQASPLPPVSLPISDEAVVQGEKAGVSEAIRWLVTWCVRTLKKSGIRLVSSKGKVIRVKK